LQVACVVAVFGANPAIVATVPACPLTSPVTSPVISPTKAVDVIDVAPVTTPASILIAPSKTIAEPAAGVRFKTPEVASIVLPLVLILSTCRVVKVPSDVIFP